MSKYLFAEYYGILFENMTVPVALFLDEEEAIKNAQAQFGKRAIIVKYPVSSLCVEVQPQYCNNPEHQQQHHHIENIELRGA